MHPEKNMRLTKQLKAQANSIKFASQLPTNSDYTSNNHSTTKEPVTNDGQSTVLTTTNTTEENNQQLLTANRKVALENSLNHNNQRKIPTIITTSHSDSCLNDGKKRFSTKRYNYDDQDSLNSNIIQEEQIML